MGKIRNKVFPWLIAVCGLWEFGDIAAFFTPGFGVVKAPVVNHILVGVILVITGSWAALTEDLRTARTMHWIAFAAGAWLVVATFLLRNPTNITGLLNDLIVGVLVTILAGWSALVSPSA